MVAKLRTLSGCLQCRRRRKKCDEDKPACRGCRRNGLLCQWQSADHVDKRRSRRRRAVAQKASPASPAQLGFTEYKNEVCVPIGISLFQHALSDRDSMLIEYCLFSFLPSQYHQAVDGKSTVDLSYLRYLCLESPLLLNAVSACAMVSSSSVTVSPYSHDSSHNLYMAAISEISAGIAKETLTGTEDSLLATVIWLCVYENLRVEARRHNSIHAAALRRILLLRQPMDAKHASESELTWERMCVESYIYHSAITTLFDGNADLIEDTLVVLNKFGGSTSTIPANIDLNRTFNIDHYRTPQPIVRSPVLGAPYNIFFFLMAGTRLARDATLGFVADEKLAWSQYYQVRNMQSTLEATASNYYCDSRRWIGKLYAVGIRFLYLYIISVSKVACTKLLGHDLPWCTEFYSTLTQARELLKGTSKDIDRTWGKFFLWPLAIIGAVLYDVNDITLARSWLDRVVRKSKSSSILVIRHVLEHRIWSPRRGAEFGISDLRDYSQGLEIMLDTEILNQTAGFLLC